MSVLVRVQSAIHQPGQKNRTASHAEQLELPGDGWIWAISGVAVVLIASVLAPGAVTAAGGLFLLLGGVLLEASVGADFSPSSLVSALFWALTRSASGCA